MVMQKGTTVSALWWQDVSGTSFARGEEENADGGVGGDTPPAGPPAESNGAGGQPLGQAAQENPLLSQDHPQ